LRTARRLIAEVVERELVAAQLLLQRERLLLVVDLLGALDQREHVAHAEDARRHPIGMEHFQGVELLADAGEQHRRAGHRAHRERRAAALRRRRASVITTPPSGTRAWKPFATFTAS
jgi:hypothetical protein